MAEPHSQPDPADLEGFDPEIAGDDKPSRRINLSTVQIGAAAAASVTSALAASFFGVAGTLIGAAVGSIVSTVAGAIYADSMRRAAERVRSTQAIVIQKVVPTGTAPTVRLNQQASPPTVVNPVMVNPTVVNPAVTVPVQSEGTRRTEIVQPVPTAPVLASPEAAVSWWRRRPVALVGMMLLGFVIAVGVITGIEELGGGTLSGDKGSPSISRVFSPSGAQTDDDTPVSTPSETASPSATSSPEASQAPVAPTASAAPSASTEPTARPSLPSTTAPSTTASSDGALTGDSADARLGTGSGATGGTAR